MPGIEWAISSILVTGLGISHVPYPLGSTKIPGKPQDRVHEYFDQADSTMCWTGKTERRENYLGRVAADDCGVRSLCGIPNPLETGPGRLRAAGSDSGPIERCRKRA